MKPIVFSTAEYTLLGQRVAKKLGADLGEVELKFFSDGERYIRLISSVRDREVILVGGTTNDQSTMEFFDLACGITEYGAKSLKMAIPYFGYSTMERATREGEAVAAKTRARLISAIPASPLGNQVLLLDLHSEGIPFYFEGGLLTRHLYAKSVVMKTARDLAGEKFILGSVDAGRAKWVESLANDLGVGAGFIYKRRSQDGDVSVSGVNISVGDENVVIYDDMIRSGSSLIQAAEVYKRSGAKKIWAITTHGVFSAGGLEKLKQTGIFECIVCTDSHPNALAASDPFLKVISTDEIFARALRGETYS